MIFVEIQYCNEQTTDRLSHSDGSFHHQERTTKVFFSFFSQTWVYIQLHPTRSGNCGNLCTQLFTAQLRGFLWTQVGQMLVASWCRKCSQGSKMKQFLSMSFCSVVWGPGEHSNIQVYIYIYRCEVIWRCGNNAGLLLWKQSMLSCILQSSHFNPFHAFYNVEVVGS